MHNIFLDIWSALQGVIHLPEVEESYRDPPHPNLIKKPFLSRSRSLCWQQINGFHCSLSSNLFGHYHYHVAQSGSLVEITCRSMQWLMALPQPRQGMIPGAG